MKVYMKPVKMIAWFEENGRLTPVRYLLKDSQENVAVKVDRVITVEEEKTGGNRMYVYRCQSLIDGVEKVYELKYELCSCKWFLYKF